MRSCEVCGAAVEVSVRGRRVQAKCCECSHVNTEALGHNHVQFGFDFGVEYKYSGQDV